MVLQNAATSLKHAMLARVYNKASQINIAPDILATEVYTTAASSLRF